MLDIIRTHFHCKTKKEQITLDKYKVHSLHYAALFFVEYVFIYFMMHLIVNYLKNFHFFMKVLRKHQKYKNNKCGNLQRNSLYIVGKNI